MLKFARIFRNANRKFGGKIVNIKRSFNNKSYNFKNLRYPIPITCAILGSAMIQQTNNNDSNSDSKSDSKNGSNNDSNNRTNNNKGSSPNATKKNVNYIKAKKQRKKIIKRRMEQRELNESLGKAQKILEMECIKQGIPGCSICVIKDGSVIYTDSYGYLDVDSSIKINANTLMHIASISKPMTAMGLLKLLDLGFVKNLDMDIRDIIPINSELSHYNLIKDKDVNITLRQLLQHTSGIRHYEDPNEFLDQNNQAATPHGIELMLSSFLDGELKFEPGNGYCYSSYAYILLGILILYVSISLLGIFDCYRIYTMKYMAYFYVYILAIYI